MIAAFALAVTLAGAGSSADDASKVFAGPMHYCGQSFAVDLAPGEKIEMREGPDFFVGSLISEKGGYGIYEGNFPQSGTQGKVVETSLGKVVKRMPKDDYGLSYLIATGEQFPAYVHVWGAAFTGGPNDVVLLKRMNFAPAAGRHCQAPTFDPHH